VSNQRPGNGAGDGRFEPLRGVGASDYFERPFTNTFQRLAQFLAGIAASGEDMAQPWRERADRSEHAPGTIAILNVGLMHDQPDQIALRVGDDVALAALDLLSCVIAPRAAALRGFHRLAVNHSCRRARPEESPRMPLACEIGMAYLGRL
jgi:hypothetical protein